jgi:DNA-directed RNA polymerase specialized sigma24 family protein
MHDPFAAPGGRSTLERSSDEQLVEALRDDVHHAVEVLFDRHCEAMLCFCRHLLGRRDEAEDVVRESFDQALRVVRRHDRPVRIRALLLGIARNRCLAELEARAPGDVQTDFHGLHPEVARDVDLALLADAVGRLPLDQRVVLLLRSLEGVTREEVGAIAGCASAKADALLVAARTALTAIEPSDNWACGHVRPLLAASGGAAPSREALRRHMSSCESCEEFRREIARQTRWLGIVLPVTPSASLAAPQSQPPQPPPVFAAVPPPASSPPLRRRLRRRLR